jgi:hypothetical protein
MARKKKIVVPVTKILILLAVLFCVAYATGHVRVTNHRVNVGSTVIQHPGLAFGQVTVSKAR